MSSRFVLDIAHFDCQNRHMPPKLTPHEKIKRFIVKYRAREGCSPSLQEIADGCGWSSHNTVRMHLLQMKASGEVSWVDGKYRTVRVLESA